MNDARELMDAVQTFLAAWTSGDWLHAEAVLSPAWMERNDEWLQWMEDSFPLPGSVTVKRVETPKGLNAAVAADVFVKLHDDKVRRLRFIRESGPRQVSADAPWRCNPISALLEIDE